MGRLIDTDVALQRFIKEAETSGKGCIHINTIKRLLQDIDTAYDVEKGDLISRQAVIDIIQGELALRCGYDTDIALFSVKKRVSELPTAYDVEAVVAELENKSDFIVDGVPCISVVTAKSIVQRGDIPAAVQDGEAE